MAHEGNSEQVAIARIDGHQLEIVGTRYDDTPEGTFEHFDVFEDGACLNEGDPFASQPRLADLVALIDGLANVTAIAWVVREWEPEAPAVFTRITTFAEYNDAAAYARTLAVARYSLKRETLGSAGIG